MKDYQNTLFPYAYNVLGSSADAKDAIQDVLLKYTSMDVQPGNEKNYLIRGVINQSINIKRKKKKMQPLGSWLPEPVSTETPDLGLEMKELVSYSLLFLLEQLNPKERAVYILNEAFAYSHREIADVLSCSVENSRQLLSRARLKIQKSNRDPGETQKSSAHFEKIEKYLKAILYRDTETLQEILSDDITYYADGGDKVNIVKQICSGNIEVSKLLLYIHHEFQQTLSAKPVEINHQPAFLFYEDQKLKACQIYGLDEQHRKIQQICTILDPDKLKNIG